MENDETFEEYLKRTNLSKNTLTSYLWTVKYFNEHYETINKENLLAYKGYLMEYYKPKTVNLRIQGTPPRKHSICEFLLFLQSP